MYVYKYKNIYLYIYIYIYIYTRGPEKEPKGLVVDLYRHNLGNDEYFHNMYMILGRAQKLEWLLLRNFPHTADGEPNWSVFERGPSAYLREIMEALDKRAKETWPRYGV